MGEKGEQGLLGHRGEQGMRGEKGERGEQGLLGRRGEQGVKGEKGEQGLLGHRGEQGVKGEKGERGEQGEKGERGVKGEKGERGAKGEKGEPGDFLECTSQNQMIDRVSDKLTRHIRNVPSVVREVMMSEVTKMMITDKIGMEKDEEKSIIAKEIRRLKNRIKHPLSNYQNWYNCGEKSTRGRDTLVHKHNQDAKSGPHPDALPEGWTIKSEKMTAESEKLRDAAIFRSFRAQEPEREKSLKENAVT